MFSPRHVVYIRSRYCRICDCTSTNVGTRFFFKLSGWMDETECRKNTNIFAHKFHFFL